ncbi:DUN1 [Candida margitis]|uniref:DUN1 n=1 Tax=Candida margitis TaxID=1775924 RepID=UPI002227CC22|nr:DUN1 [Candida margitis]KAI5962028.1 DUN1 [Candida margitis]
MSLIRKRQLITTEEEDAHQVKRQATTITTPLIAKLYSTRGAPTIDVPNKSTIFLGRSKACDVQLQGVDVSSKHCQLDRITSESQDKTREYLQLTDLSSNGVYINGEKMDRQTSSILKTGDKLQFAKTGGNYIFRYTYDITNDVSSDVPLHDNSHVGKSFKNSFFDDYILGKQLGTGHYAIVREAKNKQTGQVVAVKVFHPNKTNSAAQDAKLQQEMNLLLSINHPNIVQFVGHYIEPNNKNSVNTYLVLEKVNNGELFQRIVNKQKLRSDETRAIFKQLLSGLKYLHDNDIIHRDIKPENILLDITRRENPQQEQTGPWDPDELELRVKIADFGLAKFIGELKFTNTLCGTPAYVAPEILKYDRNYSTKVDLWSSGVLLYVCLSGFPPFSDELAPPNMKEQILTGKYAFYSPYFDEIDDVVLDLITNLLKVDPEERFDVEHALNHEWFQD